MAHPLISIRARCVGAAFGTALLAAFGSPQSALAHTGADVPWPHVLLEVGEWTLGAAGVLAVLVALLWLRARRMRGGR